MTKVKTTKIGGGADYAKVSERLKAFRSENPRASIVTIPIPQEGGMMMFKAHIVKDKSDEFSADATGHALQTKTGLKDFEKLETIAVGRALALLGYASDGEIASSDEMEEFLDDTSTPNVTYVGKSAIGSATSASAWQIQKIDETSGMSITWAGTGLFTVKWDDRTTESYT